jgi:hypothetical protein
MALLTVLKVALPAGGGGAGTKDYYFQGGNVYTDSAIATATGVSVVANFEHDEPLCTIEQLTLSKKIMRFVCELTKDVNGKKVRKTATIYCARDKAPALLSGNALNGKEFKVKVKNVDKSLGKIVDVRTSTRDTFK